VSARRRDPFLLPARRTVIIRIFFCGAEPRHRGAAKPARSLVIAALPSRRGGVLPIRCQRGAALVTNQPPSKGAFVLSL
jgi:hypothetical protein